MQTNFPVILIVAYDRPDALKRILNSVAKADYSGYSGIQLVISIDGGGELNREVKEAAGSFQWAHGEKEIITHLQHLGLRNHIISCGDLTERYENLIVLEDDGYVSRNFYDFAVKSLSHYYAEPNIAGISLYSYNYYESFTTVFIPVNDGYDVYFMQVPASLGQLWTKEQWIRFRAWYNTKPVIQKTDKIPEKVKTWPENSWKKYFYKYMVENNLFFVYPYLSFTTNFGDAGTHFPEQTQNYQVALENYGRKKHYNFPSFEHSCNKYDAYYEILPGCLMEKGADIDPDTCVDILGSKPLHLFSNKYALSVKSCSKPVYSFDDSLIPVLQNVIHRFEGNAIHYALKEHFGAFIPASRLRQIENAQTLGFSSGKIETMVSKYHKLGYYLLNPAKFPGMLKRKFVKKL